MRFIRRDNMIMINEGFHKYVLLYRAVHGPEDDAIGLAFLSRVTLNLMDDP